MQEQKPESRTGREERREWRRRHRGPFLIPAGALIGLGVGLLVNQAGAGVLIGLGLGFLGSVLIPAPSRDEPVSPPVPMRGSRWVPAIIGIFLVLAGVSIVSGISLPWTTIIAVVLILIGIWLIARGFGRMR
jgi:hypothetical protein